MLVTGIKSKPIYSPLSADARGRFHLMLGMGVGETALLRVLREMQGSNAAALAATRVMLVPEAGGAAAAATLESQREIEALPLQELRQFPDTPSLLAEFKSVLADSLMGTRVYLAGPESFIGLAMRIALDFNLNKDE